MTTFDLIALLLATLIVIMLLFFGVVWKLLNDIKEWQKSICDKLCSIRSDTVDIFQELNNIEDDILDDLRDIDDKLDNMLTIYYMQHNAKFNEVMIERMKQGLKDIPLYPPEFMKPPFNPTCDTTNTNKED